MAIERARVILLMRKAFRTGQSASAFIGDMRAKGLSYRRVDMLSDWRSVNELEKKEGAFRFVRKDRYPAEKSLAEVEWKLSREYMYKVKVSSQIKPDEPITERFVNIMQDRPLTPAEVEALAWDLIKEQSPKEIRQVTGVTAWSAIERVTP